MSIFKTLQSNLDVETIGTLLDKLQDLQEDKKLDLNPVYQRNVVWTETNMSQFISSIMNGIISMNITINKNSTKWICMDGKQRLTSLLKFYQNEIPVIVDPINDTDSDSNSNSDSDNDSNTDDRIQYIYYEKIPAKNNRNREFNYQTLSKTDRDKFLETKIPITYYNNLSYEQQAEIFSRIQHSVVSTDGERTVSAFKNESVANKFKKFCEAHNYSGTNKMKNVNNILNIMYMSHYKKLQMINSLNDKTKFIKIIDDDKIIDKIINDLNNNLKVYFSKSIMGHQSISDLKVTINFIVSMFYMITSKFGNLDDKNDKNNLTKIRTIIINTWKDWNKTTNLHKTKSSKEALDKMNDIFDDVIGAYDSDDSDSDSDSDNDSDNDSNKLKGKKIRVVKKQIKEPISLKK
jgi:hypothetical protein